MDPDQLAFKVALPNGRYLVTLIVGDMQIPRFGMDLYANGYLVTSNLFTGKIQFRGYSEPAGHNWVFYPIYEKPPKPYKRWVFSVPENWRIACHERHCMPSARPTQRRGRAEV